MVIAHRGYHKYAKENTIAAFDAAITAGAQGIECDLRLTADNQAVIYHNGKVRHEGKNIKISDLSINKIKEIFKNSGQNILNLDDLFEYIKKTRTQFFLEVKNSSPFLVDSVAKKIKENNLWKQVNIIGFSYVIKNALLAQAKHPKLQVGQFLHIHHYFRINQPKKSYSVFMGWLDSIPGTQKIFKTFMTPRRLLRLKKSLEKNGFRVMAGVINNDAGLKLFQEAGITDIVTDRVSETVDYFKNKS